MSLSESQSPGVARQLLINRLRRFKTTIVKESRIVLETCLADPNITVEKFRLLMILSGAPAGVLFYRDMSNNIAVPLVDKESLKQALFKKTSTVDRSFHDKISARNSSRISKEKGKGGDNILVGAIKPFFDNWFNPDRVPDLIRKLNKLQKNPDGDPESIKRVQEEIDNLQAEKVRKTEAHGENTFKLLQCMTVFLIIDVLIGNVTQSITGKRIQVLTIIKDLLFLPFDSQDADEDDEEEDTEVPVPDALRPGWVKRTEPNTNKVYFYNKSKNIRDNRCPIIDDELPPNWEAWLHLKTGRITYQNVNTGKKKSKRQIMREKPLRQGWTEEIHKKRVVYINRTHKLKTRDRPIDMPELPSMVKAWQNYKNGKIVFVNEKTRKIYKSKADMWLSTGAAKKLVSADEDMQIIQTMKNSILSPAAVLAARLAVLYGLVKVSPMLNRFWNNKRLADVLNGEPSVDSDIPADSSNKPYKGVLQDTDPELHQLFVEYDDLNTLRFHLLALRKPREAFYQYNILPYHFIRTNGQIRTSVNEIARAIAYHWKWSNIVGVLRMKTTGLFNYFAKSVKFRNSTRKRQSGGQRVNHKSVKRTMPKR